MIVIKVGGGEGNSLTSIIDDLVSLWQAGTAWVLVHGGSAYINDIASRLGHPPQFMTSPSGYTSRRTDYKTLKILTMVLAGHVNTQLVTDLQTRGVNAVGLTGLDGRLLTGNRKKAIKTVENGRVFIVRDDYTGIIKQVNTNLLHTLLNEGYAPVVCPPAISEESEIINIDSDRAAAAIAIALQASTRIILTNTVGLLQNPDDPNSLIPKLNYADIESARQQYAKGRMKHKLLAAAEAIERGVARVIITNSTQKNPIQAALKGAGTQIE